MSETNDTAAGPYTIGTCEGEHPYCLLGPPGTTDVRSDNKDRAEIAVIIANEGWRAGRASRDEEIAALSQFKTAVIEAAVVDGTYKHEHETDARKAVNDLLCHAQKIALDPRVSSEARAMVERAETAESQVKRLADDALVALAGAGVCTPEETFIRAPHCLTACIHALAKDRDTARERVKQLGEREKELEDALRDALEIIGSGIDLMQRMFPGYPRYDRERASLIADINKCRAVAGMEPISDPMLADAALSGGSGAAAAGEQNGEGR